MKTLIATVAAACLLASLVWAHEHAPAGKAQPAPAHSHAAPAPQLDAHTQEDIERHRGMARAHEQAAQCLASGSKYDDCQKQLQTACKGLALGKNCGMRHAH